MLLELVTIILGLGGLFIGGELMIKSAARLASSFGISTLVIGLTVVAWATSTPELVVNVSAAVQGSSAIALGNVVGSNIANIGLTLGLIGLAYTVTVKWSLTQREIPIMLGASLAAYALALDGKLDHIDGLLLSAGFIGYTALIYVLARREQRQMTRDLEEYERHEHLIEVPPEKINRLFEVVRLLGGLALLSVGADLTVDGAAALARALGVSELVIGMTLVAVGTSLPELAASLVAARQGQSDIAVGNLIGSNIANILAILGVTSAIHPIEVDSGSLALEIPVMLAFSAVLLFFGRNQLVRRLEGGLLVVAYIGFVTFSFLRP